MIMNNKIKILPNRRIYRLVLKQVIESTKYTTKTPFLFSFHLLYSSADWDQFKVKMFLFFDLSLRNKRRRKCRNNANISKNYKVFYIGNKAFSLLFLRKIDNAFSFCFLYELPFIL